MWRTLFSMCWAPPMSPGERAAKIKDLQDRETNLARHLATDTQQYNKFSKQINDLLTIVQRRKEQSRTSHRAEELMTPSEQKMYDMCQSSLELHTDNICSLQKALNDTRKQRSQLELDMYKSETTRDMVILTRDNARKQVSKKEKKLVESRFAQMSPSQSRLPPEVNSSTETNLDMILTSGVVHMTESETIPLLESEPESSVEVAPITPMPRKMLEFNRVRNIG